MRLETFKELGTTDFQFNEKELSTMPCGLFRHPAHKVQEVMPLFGPLINSAPVADLSQYEVDIKIHMLMAGQYPCIPNWHCDNVPRNAQGEVDYGLLGEDQEMLMWVSDGPETEFLAESQDCKSFIKTHESVARHMRFGQFPTKHIKPNSWISMTQRTPHRGTMAQKAGWRVFVRLTPKTIAPDRPVHSTIRRHCQVYLDANYFTW